MHRYSFEVVPVEEAGFEPFVLDVPALELNDQEHARAARRAWWSAFAHLNGTVPGGCEPEQFDVFSFEQDTRGRRVGSGGFALEQVNAHALMRAENTGRPVNGITPTEATEELDRRRG